jgi:type IV pilus assembly protein PilB
VRLAIDDNAPVVQVVSRILTEAVRDRASDIHIEPQDKAVRVRFRVDGALHDTTSLPSSMAQALVSRIKIMAGMNIVERRRAQDGQFEASVDGRPLDVRVATTATIWGEKAVLRILDKSRSLLDLKGLGMSVETREEFSKLIRTPFGMVLCAGPTGSGKTTTLYAGLTEINDPARNITTIEDPVEYVYPSINQIQINEAAEVTFAGGLRAILRQDPDVILVGEIRDVETARIAVQSALTGHLVLSSVHAIDAAAALHRFLDMGIESFLIASSVIGVVAQRLVRRTCVHCTEPYEPTADERAIYDEWGGKPKTDFMHGAGCNFCSQTGYVDRVGVYELLRVSDGLRRLIVEDASLDAMRAAAVEEGMRTLRDEAMRLIEDDVTTIGEVVRNIYTV